MSVNYYGNPDTAYIGVSGEADIRLVSQALKMVVQDYPSVFTDEVARIEQGSQHNDEGKVLEFVFGDADERRLVTAGLRALLSDTRRMQGVRARLRERRALNLVKNILAAEYLPTSKD